MLDLDAVKDFRVLMVGDGIIDEYHYVTPLGKSIKEHVISVELQKKETFNGGIWAAAQHVKGFCKTVDVQTGPVLTTNTRFIDAYYLRKIGLTAHAHSPGTPTGDVDIRSYDVVIVADFGHGTLNKPLIERLTREAKFLAVNAQTNSQNYGFNLITKYTRADLVVVDEIEARLATHDRDSSIEDVIAKLGFEKIIVTMGAKGAVGFDGAYERQPAITDKIIDTMGAGDAFLSVTAPFAAAGFKMRDLVKIGNAAGAAKTGIIGHRGSVTKELLEKYLG